MQYVRISDIVEVRKFIRDLRATLHKAERSGGGHSAFLHNENSDAIFQLEIAPRAKT